MSNLSIENIAGALSSGDAGTMLGKSPISTPAAPEALTLRNMQQEGLSTGSAQDAGKGFGEMLTQSIEKVNEAQVSADTAMKELTAGRTKNIHETMLTIEKADASLKLMMQVRNKVLDAYKEIMRMQV